MQLQFTEWRKSSYSGPNNECVEIAFAPALVGLRDSKNPDAGTLVFDRSAWQALLTQA